MISYISPIIQALAPCYVVKQVAGGSSGLSLATLFMVLILCRESILFCQHK